MTEFNFIKNIAKLFSSIPNDGIMGIGDDCATIPIDEGHSLLLTSDMLIEDVHFLREAISPYSLGRKSLTVNLSDVAAMGARPIATLLSLSVPRELMGEWIEEFMRGYHSLSLEHGVQLIGGDTTSSTAGISINVTAIGRAENKNIKYRSAAELGDIIMVSGYLGGSAAGLRDILNGEYDTPLAQLHNAPTARIAQGAWLGGKAQVHAMIDISDGIASDIEHILERSAVGCEIELEALPTDVDIATALGGGEDYELLLTVEPAALEELTADYRATFNSELYPIGKIIDNRGVTWLKGGAVQELDIMGFRHF